MCVVQPNNQHAPPMFTKVDCCILIRPDKTIRVIHQEADGRRDTVIRAVGDLSLNYFDSPSSAASLSYRTFICREARLIGHSSCPAYYGLYVDQEAPWLYSLEEPAILRDVAEQFASFLAAAIYRMRVYSRHLTDMQAAVAKSTPTLTPATAPSKSRVILDD